MITKSPPDLDSQGRDRNDYARCKRCGASALDVELSIEPTMSMLVFGPFPGMRVCTESRCEKCEKEVCKSINKMLESI
mgnify:CR=1 FL=1